MQIPSNIKTIFEKTAFMALSTADKNGVPNVAVIASKRIIADDTILTIDTFHNKTLSNIKENDLIALALWQGKESYQIKGKATYHTSGDVFETGKNWILESKPNKIVKGVIEIKVTEIFYLTPSYELAGKSIIE